MSLNPKYCAAFVTPGGCPLGLTCPKRHDICRCTCGAVMLSRDLETHKKGKKHRKALELLADSQGAPLPGLTHNKGRPVKAKASAPIPLPRSKEPPPNNIPNSASEPCTTCKKMILVGELRAHVEEHERRKRVADIQAQIAEAQRDKNGITITPADTIDFGVIDDTDGTTSQPVSVKVLIRKTGDTRISLSNFWIASSLSRDGNGTKFSAVLSVTGESRWLNKGRPRVMTISFHPSFAGRFEDSLELVFFELRSKTRFVITRPIVATVGSKSDHEQLKPTTPYVRRPFVRPAIEGPVIRSLRPPVWSPVKWSGSLPEFKAPAELIKAAFDSRRRERDSSLKAAILKDFVPTSFNVTTYGKYFQVLLYIEEERMKRDLEAYSLFDAELKPDHPRYDVYVKGLAEDRPSVLVGDYILVKRREDAVSYEGRVHAVKKLTVSLRFSDQFSTYKGNKFDVRFVFNRLPMRRMHHSITNSFNPTRILFPSPEHILGSRAVVADQIMSIALVNRLISSDKEQLETVAAIVHQPPGSVPFVVFGPPGTGKTVTIVEAIRQLLLRDPHARILVCAPSNSAADVVAIRLLNLGTIDMFRLNSMSRKYKELAEPLRPFSLANDNLVFAIPSAEQLLKYRVVVSTCISGGIPGSLGMKQGHFSHIFIDEAGQGSEPEVMVPIKSIAGPLTNIVLAGDNQQLGPVVFSQLAGSLGLKRSYLARIMALRIYELEAGRRLTIVKLVKNFRNHPSILKFANDAFYQGELITAGDPALIQSHENSDVLVTKKFPLVFHGVVGRDQQENHSPSFFNIDEATLVKKTCLALVGDRKHKLLPKDIGVITPYHAQRCKILDLFRNEFKLNGIKVGSVEEFQGQERRVIIMSTVRSSTAHINADIRRTLGFVANPRRFNVAITRAQALLYVIGNPHVLALDPLWRRFLNYVHLNKGWRGTALNWNPEEPVEPSPEGYAEKMRQRAEGEANETIERLKSLIALKTAEDGIWDLGVDDDDDSGSEDIMDRPGFARDDD